MYDSLIAYQNLYRKTDYVVDNENVKECDNKDIYFVINSTMKFEFKADLMRFDAS